MENPRHGSEPIEFLPHEYVLAHPRAPRPIAIEGVMRVGDLVLITGSWDTYKSTLAMELAWSLATGRRWLGRPEFTVEGTRRMGILQTEIDPGAYDERCARFPLADKLSFASVKDFTFDRIPELAEAIEDAVLDGIILDPIGQMWPSQSLSGEPFSENQKNHVSPLMRELKWLSKTIILVHHDPKQPKEGNLTNRASGSSALLNDPDVRIFVDRLPGDTIKVTVRNRLQRPTLPFIAHFNEETLRLYAAGVQPDLRVRRKSPVTKRPSARST